MNAEKLLHKFELVKLFWSSFVSLQLSLVQPNPRRMFLCLEFSMWSTVVLLKIKLKNVNNYLKAAVLNDDLEGKKTKDLNDK